MITQYVFKPSLGAHPLLFGMSVSSVVQLLGIPLHVTNTVLGRREDQYDGLSIRYSEGDVKVMEISITSQHNMEFSGQNIFHLQDPISFLQRYNSIPYEWVGFVILLQLGIAVSGFHDNDGAQQGATIFLPGAWDDCKEEFVLFERK